MEQNIIKIAKKSNVPKYKQLIQSVYHAIENKALKKGDKIPSVNTISKELSLSRDTVLTAFNELKARGIIDSTPGKGYYVNSTEFEREQKIFLLFDELNPFKETLYYSFLESIKDKASVDIYFHYFNKRVFRNLIMENLNKYTTYIIMPVFFKGIEPILRVIKNGRIYILDQLNPEIADIYPAIYQNFEKDVYHALFSGLESLKKYDRVIMVHPGGKEPQGQVNGFIKFCEDKSLPYEVINNLKEKNIRKGEAYIVLDDLDLVRLVKDAKKKRFRLGKDTGIISYNDTPLKEVVADGITTISTDFRHMGKVLADMVLNKKRIQIENPSSLVIRNSL
ncbi:MAG: GntR family transcriptional regulator [Bacteroidales bacterium]